MVTAYTVRLSPKLILSIGSWNSHDQDALLGFQMALEECGFDAVCGVSSATVPGMNVEYVEPGETPDMVWARIFLDLASGESVALRVDQRGSEIVIGTG